jgi:hypothetical protein
MDLVREANDMILSKRIDYEVIRQVNSLLQKGSVKQLVYLVLPELNNMLTGGQQEFILSTYETALKSLEKVKVNTCCIVSVVLEPHIGRIDMGSRVVLEKGLHLIVLHPQRVTLSVSGYQVYSGLLRTRDEPGLSGNDFSHPVYYRSDEDLEYMAREWVEELRMKGDGMTEDSILGKIETEMRERALEPELIDVLLSKMKRIAHGIQCVTDESIQQSASRLIDTIDLKKSDSEIKNIVDEYGSQMSRLMRRQILNVILAYKYDITCSAEESFKKVSKRYREKSAEKAAMKENEQRRDYALRKSLLIELGSPKKVESALYDIIHHKYKTSPESNRILDKLTAGAQYLVRKIGNPTKREVELYIDQQAQTTPVIARMVKDIMIEKIFHL